MNYAPHARILIRYLVALAAGAGLLADTSIGHTLASNPDVVAIVSAGIALAVEWLYARARKLGAST